ncbi:MAG TPA: FAD-binding oxidoreductase [Anaerovoracaceae bacterium]|nr:FAD-binding oxidoreductase [Anaerovoracaceae bacterium]
MNQYFNGLTGKVITRKSPFYNEARQVWNRAIQRFPLAIVYCNDKNDVANAMIWARQHSVPIRIRSGGHNYEGYSIGNDVLVIDVSNLNSLGIIDNHLYVDGGINNKQLYDFLSCEGYPFPGGTCPTVGLSGYASGGGWGLSCRLLGLGCDSLVELELVDAEGKIIKANSVENNELFWACRGAGGGNFGIIVSMVFRLPPKVDMVTFFQFHYPDTDQKKQAKFIGAWQKWLKNLDQRMSAQANIYHSPEDNFAISGRGLFYGTEVEAQCLLQPIISLDGCRLTLEYLTFYEAITKIGEVYPDSGKFKSPGRFVVKPLNPQEIYEAAGLIRDVPIGSVYSSINLYSLGGKVSEKSPDETAFFYRDASYIILIQSVWEESQYALDNKRWVSRKIKYLKSITQGSYVNFPYSGLLDYNEAYYGGNIKRLRLIKSKYDPENVFRFPQSIR